MPSPADFEAYAELCNEVEALDPAAAAFLRGPAHQLPRFNLQGELNYAFCWTDSPQGFRYWRDLYFKIFDLRKAKERLNPKNCYANGLPMN